MITVLPGLLSKMEKLTNSLFDSGGQPIKFVDDDGRVILYAGDIGGTITGYNGPVVVNGVDVAKSAHYVDWFPGCQVQRKSAP